MEEGVVECRIASFNHRPPWPTIMPASIATVRADRVCLQPRLDSVQCVEQGALQNGFG